MIRRRIVRVPASSANLGPGFDCMAAAISLHLRARGGGDGKVRGRDRSAGREGTGEPLRARLRASAPRRRLHVQDRLADSALGRARLERRGDRRRADGRRPPVRAGRRRARARHRARGPSRQRRRRAARRIRHLCGRRGRPIRPADWLGGTRRGARAVRPHERGARRAARAGGARRRRLQRRPCLAADARTGARRLGPARARPARPPAPAPTGAPLPTLV